MSLRRPLPHLIRHRKDHIRQPALERWIVAELLEEFGVVLEQAEHDAAERLVVLDARVLAVGVQAGVLVGGVGGNQRGDFLGNQLSDIVSKLCA